MSRKSLVLAVAIALTLTGGTAAVLILLVRHEPAIYRQATVPPGPDRKKQSEDFVSECSPLITALQPGSERDWDIHLTDAQVNSYFAEDFKLQKMDKLLPEGISEPRILFEPGKVRLAFRYGKGLWSSVISIDFSLWLTREPNVVGLKLDSLQAGSLPISAQSLLDDLSAMLDENGIQIDWYRYEGHPAATLRFQSSQSEATVQLQNLQVNQGSITIRGKPVESGSTRAAALPHE